MPWYKTGTVSVTLNSNAVIGTGTSFIANCRVGDGFRGPDGGWYEITNIASDTALSISPAYGSPAAYAIAPIQGYPKDLADQVRSINNTWGAKLAALGTTGNYDVLPVSKGGTGGTTPTEARAGLELGTAATATLTTSSKDSTANRVMRVGDHGIGGLALPPVASTEINALRTNGTYYVSASVIGGLPIQQDGYLTSICASATYGKQEYSTLALNSTYVRFLTAGTWGAWEKTFKASNTVGTVSQTSGNPTGAIIERGSNANGQYTKWADGTMAYWNLISLGNRDQTISAGGVFHSGAQLGPSFAIPFVTAPTVSIMSISSGGLSWISAGSSLPTGSAAQNYFILTPTSGTYAITLMVKAIGRWY